MRVGDRGLFRGGEEAMTTDLPTAYTNVFHPDAIEAEMWESILCGLLPVTGGGDETNRQDNHRHMDRET